MHIVRGADAEDVLRRGRCANGIVVRPRITSGYVDEEVVVVVGKLKAIRNMAFSGVRIRATLQSKSAPLSKVMLIKYRNYLVHVQRIGIVPCVCFSPADRMDPGPAPCKSIVHLTGKTIERATSTWRRLRTRAGTGPCSDPPGSGDSTRPLIRRRTSASHWAPCRRSRAQGLPRWIRRLRPKRCRRRGSRALQTCRPRWCRRSSAVSSA